MCQKCEDLDKTIAKYRAMTRSIEPLTADRIRTLITDLVQQKAALHP